MFSLKGAKEWASGFLDNGNNGGTGRPNLEKFLEEVSTENTEHLFFHKKIDSKFQEEECRPTYEQLSQSTIMHEAARNLKVLQNMEMMVQERMQAHERFLSGLNKIHTTFECFQDYEGTIRQAYDALFVYVEQELQQARQQLILGDLVRMIKDVRLDATHKLADYSRELENLEKDVRASEKKLSKSKDVMNKLVASKAKMDNKDADRERKHQTNGEGSPNQGVVSSGAAAAAADADSTTYEFDSSSSPRSDGEGGSAAATTALSKKKPTGAAMLLAGASSGFGIGGAIEDKVQNIKSDLRAEKRKEIIENLTRAEKDVADDIRSLLRAIGNQDQILIGLRRAYQHIDIQCKGTIKTVLSKIVAREEESSQAKVETLTKLAVSVRNVDVDADILEFISQHAVDDLDDSGNGSLMLSSQALNIMEDLTPNSTLSKNNNGGSGKRFGNKMTSSYSAVDNDGGDDSGGNGRSRTNTREYEADGSFRERGSAIDDEHEFEEKQQKNDCTLHLTRLFYVSVGKDDTEDAKERRKSIMRSSLGPMIFNTLPKSTDDNPTNELHPLSDSPLVEEAIRMNLQKTASSNGGSGNGSGHSLSSTAMPPSDGFDRMSALPNLSPLSVLAHCRNYTINAPLEEKILPGGGLSIEHSVSWLTNCIHTQYGRDIFVTALNQFRSRKVDVGCAYQALGAVLWQALDLCADNNDISNAKVIMMLSQTFYRMNQSENDNIVANVTKDGFVSKANRDTDSDSDGSDTENDEGVCAAFRWGHSVY